MAGGHRRRRNIRPTVLRAVAFASVVVVAAAGAGGAWAFGLFQGKHVQHSAVVVTRHVPAATPPAPTPTSHKVLVAQSSPWRTSWALSLDHAGVINGDNMSCRIVAHINLSGSQVRFRLINFPGTTPVTFSHIVAAVRTSGLDVDPATQRAVTVHGSAVVTLAANGEAFTDPINLPVVRGQDIALSLAVSQGTSAPWHYWSAQSSACTPAGGGDVTLSPAGYPYSEHSEDRWLDEVQVLPQASVPTLAVYGDSLTDGVFLPTDTLSRWTDQLEDQVNGKLVALNFGVAGDRITDQAPAGQLPPRVASDVFAPEGVAAVMVEMGSNDIKAGVSAADILHEIQLLAAAVAARHEAFIVTTVPGRGDGLTAEQEQQRQLLNQSLRQYPIVADIDAALTDPSTEVIQAAYDVGDHVHPNPAGVAAMVTAIRAAVQKVPGPLGVAAQ